MTYPIKGNVLTDDFLMHVTFILWYSHHLRGFRSRPSSIKAGRMGSGSKRPHVAVVLGSFSLLWLTKKMHNNNMLSALSFLAHKNNYRRRWDSQPTRPFVESGPIFTLENSCTFIGYKQRSRLSSSATLLCARASKDTVSLATEGLVV
jgi:hypothetical protein